MDQSKAFDPENKYSVPYCWGTVGILYNKTMVDEPIDSWSVLWDPKYKDSILMQDSVRDAFGVTLKYLGYSLNSTDLDELNEAKNLLIKQKPLVQAYVVDQVQLPFLRRGRNRSDSRRFCSYLPPAGDGGDCTAVQQNQALYLFRGQRWKYVGSNPHRSGRQCIQYSGSRH